MDFLTIISYIVICCALLAVFGEWLYPWVDAKLYGGIYEAGKGYTVFWSWLFREQDVKIFGMKFVNAVPRYRVFQKLIIMVYWSLAYIFFFKHFPLYVNLICVSAIAGAYYWMKFERRYYYWARQENKILEFQLLNENVYWLKRIYFSGYWLFKDGYRALEFNNSSLIGTFWMYIISAIAFFIYYILN